MVQSPSKTQQTVYWSVVSSWYFQQEF